ncbi:hypothetical protein [Flavobacterium aciduliphilum]|uniref:Lipoprotein n=1 Tax=Flavobacterium aciduliphilum TaxID=1101402 RepID=A0A328YA24_9FLAO|nr:hypothetical protein [Flavobacterium aciduliphilum]RAR70858.1 hypothetical protein CLV55_109112 [Flavobacterium aciduliphilum]
MRKMTLLLACIGMISLQSCSVNETPATQVVTNNNQFLATTYEYNASFTTTNNFSTLLTFPKPIYSSDMVLVYRLAGSVNGSDLWKLLPETYYMNDGSLDFRYDFDFTKYDVSVYMVGYDLPGVSTAYRLNQVIRVVIIPSNFGKQMSTTLDYHNYEAVSKAFHIDETTIRKVK